MNLDLREIPVVYINLDRDTEKRERIEKVLSDLEFKKTIRCPGVVHEAGPKAGCALAQHNALKEIDPPFIILEDDATPCNFNPEIEIPDDSDAFYLGISSWGRMNGHSGPFVQYEEDIDGELIRVYNMLGTHAILYLKEEYISVCKKIAHSQHLLNEHVDIGFTDVQKYYNVYAFNQPLFYQTSSNGTNQKLTSYPTSECLFYQEPYWLPLHLIK